jgi:hypothetical protein
VERLQDAEGNHDEAHHRRRELTRFFVYLNGRGVYMRDGTEDLLAGHVDRLHPQGGEALLNKGAGRASLVDAGVKAFEIAGEGLDNGGDADEAAAFVSVVGDDLECAVGVGWELGVWFGGHDKDTYFFGGLDGRDFEDDGVLEAMDVAVDA